MAFIISDAQFDKWARELVELQRRHPDIAKRICYNKDFEDWDTSTGAFLPIRDPWVMKKSKQLLEIGGY